MTKNELMEKLTAIFRDQFDDDTLEISDATTANDIEDWDSLAHLQLISAIEETLDIHFTLGEINSFANVGEMAECILKHLGV